MNSSCILPTHTPELFRAAVAEAVSRLKAGELVALPTETVYGLAANALDPEAVAAIYEAKGRPKQNPIIVHVSNPTMARQCASQWPESATLLARAFWPGPLTLVLSKSSLIPEIVTAGGDTVGIRWPSHPLMQAVIEGCGFPLAAPSANLANQLSPTSAAHVAESLGKRISLIVDGGQSQVGIESTVVDLTGIPLRVLRPGMIHESALRQTVDEPLAGQSSSTRDEILKSPGQLPKHYSPRARMVVWKWETESELRRKVEALSPVIQRPRIITHTCIPSGFKNDEVSVIPHDAEAFARALYAELHRCDLENADLIVVEAVPEGVEWRGIADRLNRASSSERN